METILHPKYRIVRVGDEWAIKKKSFWGDRYFDFRFFDWNRPYSTSYLIYSWTKDTDKVKEIFNKLIVGSTASSV